MIHLFGLSVIFAVRFEVRLEMADLFNQLTNQPFPEPARVAKLVDAPL